MSTLSSDFTGAGPVDTLDRGNDHCTSWTNDKISLALPGDRIQDTYNSIRLPRGNEMTS